jgi:hypothetical protein
MKIYADKKRLRLNSWNIGHGNKIQHLFFLLKVADKAGFRPVIPCDSSLDDIFDLSKIKSTEPEPEEIACIYKEATAFHELNYFQKLIMKSGLPVFRKKHLISAIAGSCRQASDEMRFLHSMDIVKGYISGHFWHYDLMPSYEVFCRYVSIKENLLLKCREKYPGIDDENVVMVHLRDTDFRNHLRHIFEKSIVLPESYYQKSIAHIENKLGKPVIYHLLSDNPGKLEKIFSGRNYILHNDDAVMDWVCLFLGKNIIQSNSSFCWTASLYNKNISVQPAGGYNWAHPEKGSIPYGFKMPFSQQITC